MEFFFIEAKSLLFFYETNERTNKRSIGKLLSFSQAFKIWSQFLKTLTALHKKQKCCSLRNFILFPKVVFWTKIIAEKIKNNHVTFVDVGFCIKWYVFPSNPRKKIFWLFRLWKFSKKIEVEILKNQILHFVQNSMPIPNIFKYTYIYQQKTGQNV